MRPGLLVASFACLATPLFAQQSAGPIEIGFDASVMHISVSDQGRAGGDLTVAVLPGQSVRLAFPMTPRFSLEPALSLIYTHNDGGGHTGYSGDVAGMIYFTPDRTKPQYFVRPFVGWSKDALFDFVGGSRATAGAGLGVRLPANDHVAVRLEARYRHAFEDRGLTMNAFGLVAGLSFPLK